MKLTTRLLLLPLAVLALAGCGKDPKNNDQDPKNPKLALLQAPEEWPKGESAMVIAQATVGVGTISSVILHYNDGSEKEVEMTESTTGGRYSASLTAPSVTGSTMTYYVKAITSENRSAKSNTIVLTATDGGAAEEMASLLRLSEIGTYDIYKFIEIYNPTSMLVKLGDVSLYKNGELLVSFTSSQEIGSKCYGVLKAKGASITLPTGTVDLGAVDTGLSGSKSLSIELCYKETVIDAFANTINPGVVNMLIDDWDGEVERQGHNFIRTTVEKESDWRNGWYVTPETTAATPGKVNGTSGVKLHHQRFADDAVAGRPYIANTIINPDNLTKGITNGTNTIRVSAYSDLHNPLTSVKCSVGNLEMTNISDVWYEATPGFSGGTSDGTAVTMTISATNAIGTTSEKIEILLFPSNQVFDSPDKTIRLNEIYTTSKDGIELYNTSSNPVVIAGMRIRKNKERIFTVPGYMVLKGKGFAVLGCNGKDYTPTVSDRYLYLGSVANGLSGSKSLLIELRRRKVENQENSINIDSFVNIATSVSNPNKDSSWDTAALVEHSINGAGRKADGTGDWYVFNSSSIGVSNSSAPTGARFTQSYNQN